MPLLEAMPIIWCSILAFSMLYLAGCEKIPPAPLIAASVSLIAAIAGFPPWLQVVLCCAALFLVVVVVRCCKQSSHFETCCGLVVLRTPEGQNGTVLYHGTCYPAIHGCCVGSIPPCGSMVRILIYDNGNCIVCPQ